MTSEKKNTIFSFGGSYDIAYNGKWFCSTGGAARLYDRETGEPYAVFKARAPGYPKFTSDNRLVVKTDTGYFVYNPATKECVRKLRYPRIKHTYIANAAFLVTDDNRYIIDVIHISPIVKLLITDIETGGYTMYELCGAKTAELFYDEVKSEYYVVAFVCETSGGTEICKYVFYSFKYPFVPFELNEMQIKNYTNMSSIYYRSGKFAFKSYESCEKKICVLDVENGTEKCFDYDTDGVLYDLKLSKNQKYIATAQTFNVRIYDVEKKACVKSYDVDHGCFVDFYDNDTKLLIGTYTKGYCISIE